MSKKGLSNIVATVLIVLLALAAVAIVWGFLRPTFDRVSSTTSLRSTCFLVDLEVTQCNVVSNVATVAYRLNSDDEKLTGVVVVVEDGASMTYTNAAALVPGGVMESEIATVESVDGVSPYEARVAAIVSDGTNSEVCSESVSIVCG